jgi:hypothetical protein
LSEAIAHALFCAPIGAVVGAGAVTCVAIAFEGAVVVLALVVRALGGLACRMVKKNDRVRGMVTLAVDPRVGGCLDGAAEQGAPPGGKEAR